MKLGDLSLPIAPESARALALVFPQALATRLAQLHAQYGSTNCVLVPTALIDGRLMLCADVLTEINPGGLLHTMWQAADKGVLAREVDVLPIADAIALFPPWTR